MSEADRVAKFEALNARARRAGWPLQADATLSFDAPLLREAYAMWQAKAGGRRWPTRAEITPRAMKNFLADTAIVDVVYEPGKIRYRLRVMGLKLEEIFVRATGKFVDEVVPEPYLEKWLAIFDLAVDVGGPIRTVGAVEFRKQEYLQAEEFFAPLGNPDEPASALLGVIKVQPIGGLAAAMPQPAPR
jgi:hypothetical protein